MPVGTTGAGIAGDALQVNRIRDKAVPAHPKDPMRILTQFSTLLIGALALATPLFTATDAQAASASLQSCGNIHVEADAQCTVEVEGGCTAQCEPVNVQAACAAELKASCDGECNVSAAVDCTADCNVDCLADCQVKPAEFNCTASCQADCSADCSASCSGMAGDGAAQGRCEASCKATCTGDCDAQCTVTEPEATCEAKCTASCNGSCEARANVDCQVMCQADGYVDCEATVTGGCKTRCEKPEGALFCDGQYVDAGNNLEECIAALKAVLNITAEGSASCSGNTCMAEGSVGCNTTIDTNGDLGLAGVLGLGIVVAGVATRRRRRAA